MMRSIGRLFRLFFCCCVAWLILAAAPAAAATCGAATSQGTAPSGWQTYCWLDFSTYNDVTARSGAGQSFNFTLTDGSTLTFNLKASSTAATAVNAIAAPSWSGAAVGNTAFLGIPGKPVLYTTTDGSTVTLTISAITITPPAGVSSVSAYSFVAADAESTNENETLKFVTNGSPWTVLDQVDPISGTSYPTISGAGTSSFTETGAPGTVGGYIVGSNSPTTVTTTLKAGGLQGVMFAVRFASIRLNKLITGARIIANDQFTFRISATGSGSVLASGTTSGTGNGPFAAVAISTASGIPLTLSEVMAGGSSSTLSQYQGRLTCTNGNSGSSTPLPNNVVTSSYNFGALQFGDAVQCSFNNAAFPSIRLSKALAATGRYFASDQFTVQIKNGAAVTASATTAGSGSTVTGGDTGSIAVTAGTSYTLAEIASGGNLANYSAALACSNAANGVTTSFPTVVGASITPQMGDVITCVITNTKLANNAQLTVVKSSVVISDGVSTSNPKAIPGAIVRYTITVTNTGNAAVDASSLVLTDVLPANFAYDASTPVSFTNGSTASGLNAFNASTMVTYSSQAGGGAPYTYAPGTGYNSAVRGLRIAPTGTMAAATSAGAQPSFSVSYLGRIN